MRPPLFLISLLAVILAVTACGGSNATSTPANGGGGSTSGEIAVTGRYPAWQPSSLTAPVGQTVPLKVTSGDAFPHVFTIQELGISIPVAPGRTETKDIKIDNAGSYIFYCNTPGHRAAGMQGTLTVK